MMNYSSSSSSSIWEEKAFAEDISYIQGIENGSDHGVYVWPQRSYSCTFCMREFKSAQALGGHMNIHRTHRANHKNLKPLVNYLNLDPNSCPSSCCTKKQPRSRAFSSRVSFDRVPFSYHHGHDFEKSTNDNPREFEDEYDRSTRVVLDGTDFVETSNLNLSSPRVKSDNYSFWKKPELLFLLNIPIRPDFDGVKDEVASMDDVDLELRLGHNPKKVKRFS